MQMAMDDFIALVERVPEAMWDASARSGEWSPGKDAEHVAEGNALHQWVVHTALGQKRLRKPIVERVRLVAGTSQPDMLELLRQRKNESVALIQGLEDADLARPGRSTRSVGEVIQSAMIGHVSTHRGEILRKLRQIEAK
jgi:DinB family protein